MLQQLRMVVGTMMSALVLIGLAISFVVPADGDLLATPPAWLFAAQAVAGVAAYGLCEAVGYRTRAIAPGTGPERAQQLAGEALNATTILRAAVCEAVAILSLAAAFVVEEGGFVGYVVGAVVALALMAVHAWPGRRVLERTATSLERDGARSGMRELAGLSPQGPIQEL